MAQWIRRLPTEQEIPGSSPGMGFFPILCSKLRSWSSGYDRRLPSDGPGFNSRRAHFFGRRFFGPREFDRLHKIVVLVRQTFDFSKK